MAAFIKRILKTEKREYHSDWANYQERQQFEFERQQWRTNQWLRTM